MVLVRDWTSPLCTFVCVIDRLQVPLSWARARVMPCRLLSLPPSFVFLFFLFPPAALPALPMVDDVPVGLVDVPPVPRDEAEVPPTAALPAVPPVAADPPAPTDAPPLPTDVALCARHSDAAPVTRAPARNAVLSCFSIASAPVYFWSWM